MYCKNLYDVSQTNGIGIRESKISCTDFTHCNIMSSATNNVGNYQEYRHQPSGQVALTWYRALSKTNGTLLSKLYVANMLDQPAGRYSSQVVRCEI